jgi:spore coat polysaccharide biosynthesis predicted glycosyltransferase SpsG
MVLNIGFRCDGNSILGMGHVSRCLGLAEILRDQYADQIHFYMFDSSAAVNLVQSKGFKVTELAGGEFDDLTRALRGFYADVWVIDERKYLTPQDLLGLKSNGAKVILIDDLGEKRANADLVFYPPIYQVTQLNWSRFSGEVYSGWEWVLLKPEFSESPNKLNSHPNNNFNILVTLGGADPWGFTQRILGALDSIDRNFSIEVVTNSGFHWHDDLQDFFIKHSFIHPIKIIKNPSDMRSIMLGADLAIASFGVTAYELAATGVPSILVCPTEDHYHSALLFETNGLGVIVDVSNKQHQRPPYLEQQVIEGVTHLMASPEMIVNMGKQSRKLCTGEGVQMIAAKLHEVTENNKTLN